MPDDWINKTIYVKRVTEQEVYALIGKNGNWSELFRKLVDAETARKFGKQSKLETAQPAR